MSSTIKQTLASTPYFDDYNELKNYLRVLFRPGYSVQARELTQLQTALQNQITKFADHVFKEGDMVIPGSISIDTDADFVKLSALTSTGGSITDYNLLDEREFVGQTSGVVGRVLKASGPEDTDPQTIWVKYINTGTNGESAFLPGEAIETLTGAYTGTVLNDVNGLGKGSLVFLDAGVYYIKGSMVVIQRESLILEKYSRTPSYDIGLEVEEQITTSADDISLNDNATGSPNYAAPGAHRYQIITRLVKRTVDNVDVSLFPKDSITADNFILLARIINGRLINKVTKTDYSLLSDTLARRTFDESGNYTVRPFGINIEEHTKINTPGDDTKLSVGIEPGKAYVSGYEIEKLSTTHIDLDKARDSAHFEAASVPMLVGNFIRISNLSGVPPIGNFGTIILRNAATTQIGTARVKSIVAANDAQTEFRLYLFDINMTSSSFDLVHNISASNGMTANIILTNGKNVLFEPNRNSLVFKLPFNRVKTCDSVTNDGPPDFNYVYFANLNVGTVNVSAGTAQFTIGGSEAFEPFDEENWIMFDSTNGDIINLTSSDVQISVDSSTATINNIPVANGSNVTLIAGVKRSINHKIKSNILHVMGVTAPTNNIELAHADGYKLVGVYEKATVNVADYPVLSGYINVTEHYDFIDGQKDNYYDFASIRIKQNTTYSPNGQLLIAYEYFSHGAGDFCTVDSYNSIPYKDIPSYASKATGEVIELHSAVDFRPVRTGPTTWGSSTVCPEPLTSFTTDIQYYLNRVDKIYLGKDGRYGVIRGVSAINPELPDDVKDSMTIYTLFIPAYTFNTQEVKINIIDNKRFTMRDIGKLEQRLKRVEYYTSLSMLEKEAADKQILDPDTAIQRAKSGFLVDSFTSHNVGNVTSPEFRASIDRKHHLVRPMFSEDNVDLINDASSTGIRKTGDIITLPYTEELLYGQNAASDKININPFDVFKWEGSIELTPSSDEWKDTTRRPDVIVDQEGVFDAMLGVLDATDAIGTVWNEWQQNWLGENVLFNETFNTVGGTRTVTTIESTTRNSRTGIETSIVPDTITTSIGDRVVEVNFAPFIRSRYVKFHATRLKPNTTLTPLFDGTDVSTFCKSLTNNEFTDFELRALNGTNSFTTSPIGTSTLKSNDNGEVKGVFFIPNNESLFFKTGTRVFTLTDSPANPVESTTSASASYTAQGIIETKENVTISTRVPLIERREVSEETIVRNTTTRQQNVQWIDPLAQSFQVDVPGGVFLTSIDVFFARKSGTIPVTLQIREMNQGIPTQVVIPFSEVTLNPDQVNVPASGDDTNLLTKFTFKSPVYLQADMEYCFVLMANTIDYEVWHSDIGGIDVRTGNIISKQPYAGVLFVSQNASTWSPDQNKDLKFQINRAKFTIGSTGQLILKNNSLVKRSLTKNPFRTTSGSNVIRVTQKNHHFFNGSNVSIIGATETNGIPAAQLNATHTVSNVEMDSYTITVASNASATGIGGGILVEASENQLFNTMYPLVQHINFPGTNTAWGVRLTEGQSLSNSGPGTYSTDTTYSPIVVNQNSHTNRPKVIATFDNKNTGGLTPIEIPSFYLRGSLTSTKDTLSPVIDLERCSLVTIANRIDNPGPVGDPDTSKNKVADYIDEDTADVGSALAKYVTKNIKLAQASDGLRIFIDVNRPSLSDVDLYYKIGGADADLETKSWILGESLEPIPFSDGSSFTEVEYDIDTPEFYSYAIKIVMRSRNSSRVPTCKDLRVITLLP